ncbi:tyrosine-type recombinase/integrase [Alkalicoccus luteus]|uniref:Site-specific integrase n=1 Tax=Alkalicoccus luteus TaxID=1237094 RepID=A0A969PPA8_9BACI|nr:site-specific integrase [Alkalicoccus luteus]NJP37886.1 site-specific integrase [Alkalicoccus luteus]
MAYIEKRGKNKYRMNVIIGYTDDGKKIMERKTVNVRNATEAKKALSVFEAEVLGGNYIRPENITLKSFYPEWLEKYAKEKYAPDSLRDAVMHLNKRILPKYGNMKLTDIKPIHVVNLMEEMKKPGVRMDGKDGSLSISSIRNVHKAFTSIMRCAEEWGLIKENPVSAVKPPPSKRARTNVNYSPETIRQLIEGIKTEPLEKQVLFWIAFVTSAREGEIAALEERHLLKEEGAIRFEQSLTEVKGKGVQVKGIKNHLEGVAAIPLELMNMIERLLREKRKHKMMMRNRWEYPETIFLFSDLTGRPIRPDSISQWWSRFIKRKGIEKVRFHDLRHISITYLIEKNVPMKSISDRARHSNIGTTMNIYGHKIVEVDRAAADQFNHFFEDKYVDK